MRFRFRPALVRLSAALALAAAAAPLCQGQQRSPRPESTHREMQRSLERDLLFREMEEGRARGPAPRPSDPQTFTQLSEDFERIQIINLTLARAVASGAELDLKAVGQAASEMRKRAGRLRERLVLPGAVEERPKSSDVIGAGQLKASLAALNKLVVSFAHNPGFRNAGVVNPQWSARARADLDEIVELSGRLRKSCEQLHKAAQRSH